MEGSIKKFCSQLKWDGMVNVVGKGCKKRALGVEASLDSQNTDVPLKMEGDGGDVVSAAVRYVNKKQVVGTYDVHG